MPNDSNSPIVLISVPTELEANIIVNALITKGITANASGGFTSGFKAEAPGDVAVMVQRTEFDQARQALKMIRQEQTEIDWSKIDVGTPE